MLDIIKIFYRHSFRNHTKEIPIGLVYLGPIGHYLVHPYAEMIIFFITFLFLQIVAFGASIENELYSDYFGINPTGIFLAMFFSMLYSFYYNKNARTPFNFNIFKIFPISLRKKFLLYYLFEVLGTNLLILISVFAAMLIFHGETHIISINQYMHITFLTMVFYFLMNLPLVLFYETIQIKRKILFTVLLYVLITFILSQYAKVIHFFEFFENHIPESWVFSVAFILFSYEIIYHAFKYFYFKKAL